MVWYSRDYIAAKILAKCPELRKEIKKKKTVPKKNIPKHK